MSKKPTKDAFIAEALLIDTKPTAYNTRFRPNALQQVSDKINSDGLPLLLVHDSSKLPVGAWYEAKVEDEAVFTKFYVPKEIKEYEDITTRIDTNILDSVSIGFNAGKHDCSICGNDIQDYEACPHIPGKTYEVKDPVSGSSLGEETCFVMLDDINASEASLVYSGAVPAAKIVDSQDKAEFFSKNKLNFAEGTIEVVHNGEILHDHNVNKKERNNMEEEYQELNTKFQDLDTKYSDLNTKYQDTREELIKYKELNLEFKEKVDGFDKAVEDKDKAEQAYTDLVVSFKETVEVLALPFEADYKAPEDFEALKADLEKFIEEAKALPSGQQTKDDTELAYSEPDDVYKV
jgi:hypothetical protein